MELDAEGIRARLRVIKGTRTIEEFAFQCDLSESTISRLLSGRTEWPDLATVAKIAEAQGECARYILHGDKEKPSP